MIEVLICTIDERIKNVIHNISTQLQDVCYLVSWQQTSSTQQDPPHELLDRSDVRIVTIQGRGISANRNNALKHAKGDILVISDDDCRYTAENFKTILSTYSKYPDADIIAFQAIDENGQPYKANYPEKTYHYKKRPYGRLTLPSAKRFRWPHVTFSEMERLSSCAMLDMMVINSSPLLSKV